MFDMLPHTSLVCKGNFFLNVLGRQPKEIFLQDRLSVQAAMGFFFFQRSSSICFKCSPLSCHLLQHILMYYFFFKKKKEITKCVSILGVFCASYRFRTMDKA